MDKAIRQYLGLVVAVTSYYLLHEGAHFIYALCIGVFKEIKFMGLGIQIDIYLERTTDTQLGIFCVIGSIVTIITAYVLIFLAEKIGYISSKVIKSSMYYITIALLFIDPIYLGILYKVFGGGDMNGISLLVSERLAQFIYILVLIINIVVFLKVVLPKYKLAFKDDHI